MARNRHNKRRRKKKQSLKKPKQRSHVHAAHLERKGAGAGFHSKRGYERTKKHKKSPEEEGGGFAAKG